MAANTKPQDAMRGAPRAAASPETMPGTQPFALADLFILAAIAFGVFLLNIIGLGALEFIRHTEADRTLIAWEMTETRDWLVPRLIHSVILTKPPLFYWLLAGWINLYGEVSEFSVRLPTVFISMLFAMLQYAAARAAGGTRNFAALTATILVTSASFFVMSVKAEIDMTFGFLCAVSFYLAYFSVRRASPVCTMLAYLAAAFAFLTKGPPVVAFFAAGYLIFYVVQRNQKPVAFTWPRMLLWNALGAALFLTVVGSWLSAVAARVGAAELERQFRVEILERVLLTEPNNPRGPDYYFVNTLSSLGAWAPIFLVGLSALIRARRAGKRLSVFAEPEARAFAAYSAALFVPALIMLTIAEGKSIRYIFPVFFCVTNLTALFAVELARDGAFSWIYRIARWVSLFIGLGLVAACLFIDVPGVTPANRVLGAIALAAPLIFLSFACRRQEARAAVAAIVLCMLGLRISQTLIYAPHRNAERTVKPIAVRIHELLPPEARLYNIEVFERWISYYLKHLGRDSARLTPAEVANPSQVSGRVYLLLNKGEEEWRLDQLGRADSTTRVLETFARKHNEFLLVETGAAALQVLDPHEYFPTVPSPAYYNEPARKTAGTESPTPAAPESD